MKASKESPDGIVFFILCMFFVYAAIPITLFIVAIHFIAKYW